MVERAVSQASVAGLSELETSKVLRNTYMLLGMTLAFSAVTAGAASLMGVGMINPFLFLAGVFGLSFLVHKTANSAMGLLSVFLFTGFIGFFTGPVLTAVMQIPHGAQSVMMALGSTAVAFVGLSGYALVTKKDFSFMSGFIQIGLWAMLGAIVLSLIFDLGAFQLAISAGIVILMGSLILWQTSAIVHGGETNYIIATVTLFMSIYNLFMSLLHLFMAFGGED
ncbi:MAG: Bax inhibitor-1/YccA family protein [Pseudomonadota bacterium]